MTTYTDAFGSSTLPPAEYGYRSSTLTTDTTFVWPYNASTTDDAMAKIMEITCSAGNALTLPDASAVSTGEDFLIRNVGANALTVKKADGTTLYTVNAGTAVYFYLTDNSTIAGVYGTVLFGVGSSTVDAATLVGYGIKAISTTLNQTHPTTTTSVTMTVDETYRSKLLMNTGGAITLNLTSAATLGDDFFFYFRNSGTGTATVDPAAAELVDGQSSLTVQPGESLILVSSGSAWYSVGYGRSTVYQFTQLVKDVSAAGTITLSATEASNKLLSFTGAPASAVTIVVPSVVAVYYLSSEISTAQTITVKTSGGSGSALPQGSRLIAICDGTTVSGAQSVSASSSVSLIDGSFGAPSLNFASKTNTGLYKAGASGLGVAVNGTSIGVFNTTGLDLTLVPTAPTAVVGTNTPQIATTAGIVAERGATATLTNKTLTGTTNNVEARSLKSATTTVDVSAATAPTAGQVLTASSGTAAVWATPSVSTSSIVRSTRTSNTILAAGDKGTLIDITSGTFNQTFTAAAALGSGWWCYIKNSGTGVITLDPNVSETIDGIATIRMYPSEVFAVQCNGTSFFTVGRQSVVSFPATTITAAASFSMTSLFTDSEIIKHEMTWSLFSATGSGPELRIQWNAGATITSKTIKWDGTSVTTSTESGLVYVQLLPAGEVLGGSGIYTTGKVVCVYPNSSDGHRGYAEILTGTQFIGSSVVHKVVDWNVANPGSVTVLPSVGTISGTYQFTLYRGL